MTPDDVFCFKHPGGHSDTAKRCADNVNLHWAAIGYASVKRWVAIRLADGSSDGVLYDSKSDAVGHQFDEFLCTYICLNGMQMDVCEAEIFMDIQRKAYDAGMRFADPDSKTGGRQFIMPNRAEKRDAMRKRLKAAALANRTTR